MSTGSPDRRFPDPRLPDTVLHVVDGLGLSGKTRNLVSLATQVDRRRFAPVVCTLGSESSPLREHLEAAGVPVYTLGCGDGVQIGAAVRLARLARAVKADIIHCYNPRPMLYGGLAARMIGIRAVVGSLSAFACQMPDRAYDFLPQPLATVSRRNVFRNKLAAKSMRFLVAVSSTLGRRFCEYNGVPLDKLRVIAYGADLHAAAEIPTDRIARFRTQLGVEAGDVVIGSVGRLVEQKDYMTLLQAFALGVAQVPNLRLVIAGDGPLRSRLEQTAHSLALADRIHLLGNCDDVPTLLRSVDLFALASKFEPFGVALLEAQAAGLPIVATSVNEIPEIVTDGVSGFLAPPQDPPAMAALFVRLARDRDLRARFGARARIEAQQHSLQATVAAYERLYDASRRSA